MDYLWAEGGDGLWKGRRDFHHIVGVEIILWQYHRVELVMLVPYWLSG